MNKFLALSMAMAVISASNGRVPRGYNSTFESEDPEFVPPNHPYTYVPKPVKPWSGIKKLSKKQRKNKK